MKNTKKVAVKRTAKRSKVDYWVDPVIVDKRIDLSTIIDKINLQGFLRGIKLG